MIYEDALASVRRYVAEAFKAGTATFPHYTLHGAEHLEELDRLALLLGRSIPALPKERLDLLRLAIILHDFAMVDVPDPAREEELRRQMDPDTTFAEGRAGREFKLVAIPPESLAETLCISGRLTVIGNTYIQPEESTAGGLAGAPNRIYVGPADCGKTRAAFEWVNRLTEDAASQWVVLRTGMGTLPENIDDIVLDTSHYEERRYLLPQRAVLFLDDLPTNLPAPTGTFSANEAVSTLFRWFNELPYFRERRVGGTLRLEDTHARPDWPGFALWDEQLSD